MRHKQPETIASLTRFLIGDSRQREREVKRLIRLVREDERRRIGEDLHKWFPDDERVSGLVGVRP
jgi:signal transduction histidine kinase